MKAVGRGLSWPSIARLGLVQVAIGAVVVLMTSTLNRVMVVELGLAAAVPGALVALHFFVQLLRPKMGFGSDRLGRRIPWIVGGMALVAVSGVGAAAATAWMASHTLGGTVLALVSFTLLGVGVSASSTPLLAYLSERVDEARLPGAAALTWILMIVGIIASAGIVGSLLDPYSHGRLVLVTVGVCTVAMALTLLGVMRRPDGADGVARVAGGGVDARETSFGEAFRAVWGEHDARRFAGFIFLSMLAYSAQDIILEPFAGMVFGMTPGESTRIAGLQHAGVLFGMIGGAVLASKMLSLRLWATIGCAASAVALVGIIGSAQVGSTVALKSSVLGLGLANGVFAVAAIGSMMGLTLRGAGGAGLRMGFWGAAQAVAYGTGGFLGAAGSDLATGYFGSPAIGYALVFGVEAVLFLLASALMLRTEAASIPSSGSARLRQAGVAMMGAG